MRPLEGQLRVCELEAYKAVYCGLCRQLGQSFGLPARFTLSYDASFLALLGLALWRLFRGGPWKHAALLALGLILPLAIFLGFFVLAGVLGLGPVPS